MKTVEEYGYEFMILDSEEDEIEEKCLEYLTLEYLELTGNEYVIVRNYLMGDDFYEVGIEVVIDGKTDYYVAEWEGPNEYVNVGKKENKLEMLVGIHVKREIAEKLVDLL